ncbi:hypothetical protein [Aliamphritea spongicola]|uniref:hypothetical protein n=1 Tax=Aliamphritea spongicola TaxID=707589 RepID=UPI00196A6471|nr:hypothetical protein [Aliamphritea spongicola]MBN3560550.1 hypothetical protein [Aliamphritea spongicola]
MTKYLTLFFIITLGVAAGNLLSNYATSQYMAYQASQALNQLKQERNAAIAEQTEKQRQQQIRLESERKKTSTAHKLRKACEEWKVAHNQFRTDTSKTEMAKACKAYARYISTGY